MSSLVGSHKASRGGPSTSVTDTNQVTIKGQSYTTPRDSALSLATGTFRVHEADTSSKASWLTWNESILDAVDVGTRTTDDRVVAR